MKKKISLISITILTCIINLNIVSAENLFSDTTYPVCSFNYMPSKLPGFTSGLFNLIKLLVPIILIIMGMIDFLRAMMSSEEKKMKDSQHRFITRVIASVIIFLIMAIVQFVFKQIDTGTNYKNGFVNCIDCILNNNKKACKGGITEIRKHCSNYEGSNCPDVDDFGNECETYQDGSPYGGCRKVESLRACATYNENDCIVGQFDVAGHVCELVDGKCRVVCEKVNYSVCDEFSHCKKTNSYEHQGSICVTK